MGGSTQRPVGITILAVLAIIGGLFELLGGMGLIVGGGILGGALGGGAALFGIVLLILAIGSLAFGVGAWMLQPWAWILGVIIQSISILSALFQGAISGDWGGQIVSLLISAIILYYLFKPDVQRAFGRA